MAWAAEAWARVVDREVLATLVEVLEQPGIPQAVPMLVGAVGTGTGRRRYRGWALPPALFCVMGAPRSRGSSARSTMVPGSKLRRQMTDHHRLSHVYVCVWA